MTAAGLRIIVVYSVGSEGVATSYYTVLVDGQCTVPMKQAGSALPLSVWIILGFSSSRYNTASGLFQDRTHWQPTVTGMKFYGLYQDRTLPDECNMELPVHGVKPILRHFKVDHCVRVIVVPSSVTP